jgi:hypothetical protein
MILHVECLADTGGGFEFEAVSLAIVEGDGVDVEVLGGCDGEGCGGVESATEEDNGFGGRWSGVAGVHGEKYRELRNQLSRSRKAGENSDGLLLIHAAIFAGCSQIRSVISEGSGTGIWLEVVE